MAFHRLVPDPGEFLVGQPAVAGFNRRRGLHPLQGTSLDIAAADCPAEKAAEDGEHIAPIRGLRRRHAVEYRDDVGARDLRQRLLA
ncbi:hypothetical protein ACFSCW_06760 [Sphingomonas tabacisoli]|uniref:Uncharacterized protein n=1 Tax=Sphingomonas tabacisoli TaxID=2249466 RepID=A0ABW4I0S8_9SPHN